MRWKAESDLWPGLLHPIPGIDYYCITGDPSSGDEVPKDLVDRVQWLESLHENVL